MNARPLLLTALLAVSAPCSAAVSGFASNEVRTAAAKDRLRGIKTSLKDGTEGAKRHSDAITAAFKDTGDWAVATEAYYARKGDLVARAETLEARFDDLIGRNAPERADEVTKALDEACKHEAVLRSDYEFYMKLPRLAEAPERRHAAQAAMRLLGSTGDYPVSLAYFLDKTPNRPPFAPLPPGVMSIRHQDAGANPSR